MGILLGKIGGIIGGFIPPPLPGPAKTGTVELSIITRAAATAKSFFFISSHPLHD